jgi:hypothetical protein
MTVPAKANCVLKTVIATFSRRLVVVELNAFRQIRIAAVSVRKAVSCAVALAMLFGTAQGFAAGFA